jgi:hypothetical protein
MCDFCFVFHLHHLLGSRLVSELCEHFAGGPVNPPGEEDSEEEGKAL